MTRPTNRCIDCGKRHRIDGPRCRTCRRDNELALTDGHWVTGPHGIKHWRLAQ